MTTPSQPDYRALLTRSLLAVERLEKELAAHNHAKTEPIAVVGMACRYPGSANDTGSYWSLLASGRDAVTVVPPNRWDAEASFDADPDAVGKSYTRWGAFIDRVDEFDAAFFGISPREAVSLDPQQRMLLEVTWEALEHANIPPSSLNGSPTAVYLGISTGDYAAMLGDLEGGARLGDAYAASGVSHGIASGRLSYFFGWQGPNFALDTACSSSVVAIHNAINALRNHETNLALTGGVNLTLSDMGAILTSRARMMSFDGRCKTFDESADGYVRGEGCGMLVLKRLSDAVRDGDRVLAQIRGSAINQDGRSSGLTAPNGTAQEMVIRAALANARLTPDDIDVIEAHGTGTPLGDPIEMKALGNVFGQRSMDAPLLVGSVKTNIGHLEAASGIAGIMKMILSMQHVVVPPHLHFKRPNSMIPWSTLPVRVPTVPIPWPARAERIRRAGVSSFGFSGTNAHVVLEEPPRVAAPTAETRTAETRTAETRIAREQLLVLSAQTEHALMALATRYRALLSGEGPPALRDVAAAAALGRSHLTHRLALVATTTAEATETLGEFLRDPQTPSVASGRFTSGSAGEIAFLFSGQGAQYPGMARELYESEPVFRQVLDQCIALLDPLLDTPLLPLILGTHSDDDLLNDTAFTQPALFAVEYALAALWKTWGVEPAVVMGHSVGEYVAACIAGVFTLNDAVRLIAARARLMSELPRDGAMAAVFATRERVALALAGFESDVDIAAVNGPQSIVISGSRKSIDQILGSLSRDGIESARLNVSHAFHSPLMTPMLEAFATVAQSVSYSLPSIALISNVTGHLADAEVATAAYWTRHVRAPVLFAESVATIHAEHIHVFLEIGPAPVLTAMGQRCPRASEGTWLSSLQRKKTNRRAMLDAAARLHVDGHILNWKSVCESHRVHVDLPLYPFEREHFWFSTPVRTNVGTGIAGQNTGHPLLGHRIASPLPLFQNRVSTNGPSWIGEHRIYERALLPAAAFLELAMAAAQSVFKSDDVLLSHVSVLASLTVPETESVLLQVVVTPRDDGEQFVQVFSQLPGDDATDVTQSWTLHASATASLDTGGRAAFTPARVLQERELPNPVLRDVPAYYEKLREQGASYGPSFQVLTSIASGNGAVLGRLHLPDTLAHMNAPFALHPVMLDAAIQLIGVGLPWADDPRSADDICVPVGMRSYRIFKPAATDVWCYIDAVRISSDSSSIECDLVLSDDAGSVVAEIAGVEMQRITRASLRKQQSGTSEPNWLLAVDWQQQPVTNAAPGEDGRWLIISNDTACAEKVSHALELLGAHTGLATPGEHFQSSGNRWQMKLSDPSHYARVFEESAKHAPMLKGVVWMVRGQNDADAAVDGFRSTHAFQMEALLAALPAIANTSARLFITTRGSQSVAGSTPELSEAPLWGFANVIAAEYPALHVVRIDLDAKSHDADAQYLVNSLLAGDNEPRVALRGKTRYVARLAQGTLLTETGPLSQRLEIHERGTLSNLRLVAHEREQPGAGEIEIHVHATGLNFRDVLNALDMYPGDAGSLGNECAGVVTAIGDGVTEFVVGDEVVSMVDRSFATYVIASANQTVRKAASLSFAEAATIPVTFLTAQYSFEVLAGIKAGQKVLVHAATGGVGMAAIQLARRAGAVVFGTAGSPAKRAMALALGASHVSDSRSLQFVDDFRNVDGFDGFDVVINSLAGDFIPASLGLLKRDGHFIEIGKTGIWDAAAVASAFPGVRYHPLYLGEVTAQRPLFIRDMLQRLMNDFATGSLQPLPVTIYPLGEAKSAFRFMSQGLHTGKIVIVQAHPPAIRSDATYLVTGGLGALGLLSAGMLADHGARHFVLVGRNAPSPDALVQIQALRDRGATVTVFACDIAVREEVQRMIQHIEKSLPPLRGIMHAAGVVDDGMLPDQTASRFARVMAPKVQGGWHLHELTHACALDFFVMFSSGAALLGSPGQSNYAAANTFLDTLAYVRRAHGRHAVSINWGSWSGVGMAANIDEQHQRRWASQGLLMISPTEGVRMLQDVLFASDAASVAALPFVRARMPRSAGPFFDRLLTVANAKSLDVDATSDIVSDLRQADERDRHRIMSAFLAQQVMRVLALPSANRVPVDQSLMEIGMDSLTAMELRNRVQSVLHVRVAVGELLQGPTIDELSTRLLAATQFLEPATAAPEQSATNWEEGSL